MSAFWNIFATDKEEIPELSKEEKKIFELELNFRNLLLDQNKLNNEINELKIKVKQLEVKVSQLSTPHIISSDTDPPSVEPKPLPKFSFLSPKFT